MQRDYVPFYFTPIVTAWVGNLTVPKTAVVNGVTYNLLDVPNSLANATDTAYTNYPNSDFNYDTVEVAFHEALRIGVVLPGQRRPAVARRAAFGRHPRLGLDQPAVAPIRSASARSCRSARPRRTARRRRCTTRSCRDTTRSSTTSVSALNYRFQSGFPYSLYIPDGTVDLNVCNFNCAFFATNMDQNRSESVNLMNFRIDKSFGLGGARKATLMLDIYNLLNADPVTNFNLSVTSPRTVIAVLDPRVFQMGFRFEF